MENYICINGKKAELTEEQMKALGIELPKASPFERVKLNKRYYGIGDGGTVFLSNEDNFHIDEERYKVGNYCTDKAIMEQRALHETLNRLLWRYSMEHDGDKMKWFPNNNGKHNCKIVYNHSGENFIILENDSYEDLGAVYFKTREIAENAIEEIVNPFMSAHPEFKF